MSKASQHTIYYFLTLLLLLVGFVNTALYTQSNGKQRSKNEDIVEKLYTDSSNKEFEIIANNTIQNNKIYFDTIKHIIFMKNNKNALYDSICLSNDKLYSEIMYWLGTKYKYAGSTSQGIDCSALSSSIILKAFQISMPRSVAEQYRFIKKNKRKQINEGDLVFFKLNTLKKRRISHVGIMLNTNYFIHSSTSHGVIISDIKDEYYKKKCAGIGRIHNAL